MDTVATENDHEGQPEPRYCVADAREDKESERSFSVSSNGRCSSSNTDSVEKLDLNTAVRPLSGWRFTVATFS